tara:strand:- start:166 stop:312 length:147 start_codon:yes stop_codon:yes gene_type:complete
MVKEIILLLQLGNFYGESEAIDIAKGKYKYPRTLTEAIALLKRTIKHG